MKWRSVTLLALALALLCFGVLRGPRFYQSFLGHRLRRAAEGEAARGHVEEAIHLYALAIQRNPSDLLTLHSCAAYLGKLHHPGVLEVLRRINALEPNNPDSRLEFASASLSFGRITDARSILAGTDAPTRARAKYYHLLSVANFMAGNLPDADAACREAIKREPGNKVYLANESTILLSSPSEAVRKDAVARLEELSADDHVALTALQSLLRYAVRKPEPPPHLDQWLEAFQRYVQPRDYFYTLRLEALRRHRSEEFRRDLPLYLQPASKNLDSAAAAADWLSGQRLFDDALSFCRSLPADWPDKIEFLSPAVQACFGLNRLEEIAPLLEKPAWKAYPADTLAWRERVRRRQVTGRESTDAGEANWRKVLAAAGKDDAVLARLINLTIQWGWREEYTSTLWAVAERAPAQSKDALSDLFSLALRTGDSRLLLRVAKKQVELEPNDPGRLSNLAFLDLLLDADLQAGERIARDLCARYPGNPAFTATLAFACFKRGRLEEGLNLFHGMDAARLRGTQSGVTYGLLLAAAGKPEAADYLQGAEFWIHLPEERSLLDEARRRLAAKSDGPGSAAAPPENSRAH